MKFEEIAKLAYSEVAIPERCSYPDKYAYIMLRQLYKDYFNDKITKEKAVTEKNRIEKEYENFELELNKSREVYAHYQENMLSCNDLACRINKSKDKAEMLELALEYIAKTRNETLFYDVNIAKARAN